MSYLNQNTTEIKMPTTTTFLLAIIIGIIYPIYIAFNHKKINENIKNNGNYRLIDYKQTLIIFWGLTFLVLVNYFFQKQPEMNFTPSLSIIHIVLMLVIVAFAYFQYSTTKVSLESAKFVKEKLKDIYHYLPKSKKEFKWFLMLSISAGICEEIIFRLFLFEFLKRTTNFLIAFVLTNFIFSATHIGSGKSNLLSSFFLGLLFSIIYYFTDNIWLAIILHIAIDINAGILGYRIHKTLTINNQTSPNR